MATESQWKAVMESMRQAASLDASYIRLEVFADRSGYIKCVRFGDGQSIIEGKEWRSTVNPIESITAFGIPIDPDPAPEPVVAAAPTHHLRPAGDSTPGIDITNRGFETGPDDEVAIAEAEPAPRLSEEGRAELLAQFTAAALTGLLAGWPDFPGESPTGEATTTLTIAAAAIARETLAAFEAATRESAEKGRD